MVLKGSLAGGCQAVPVRMEQRRKPSAKGILGPDHLTRRSWWPSPSNFQVAVPPWESMASS